MAVAVNQNVRARKLAGGKLGRVGGEPVGEQPDLLAERCRARIVGEQLEQFILEDAGATWLKKDEGQAGIDLRRHAVEDAAR